MSSSQPPAAALVGRYPLRIVAMQGNRRIAAADVTLRVEDDRCLRIVTLPKFSLQADGNVEVSLQVLNCGLVDMTFQMQARHQGGWSFVVDSPELIIGVGEGPVTVKVTLRPPDGRRVGRGDRITVDVDLGAGWRTMTGRLAAQAVWPRVAAAALVAVAAAGALLLLWPDNDPDNGGNGPGPNGTVTEPPDDPGTTDPWGEEEIEVPNVVGQTADDAASTLQSAGFQDAREDDPDA